MGQSSLFLAFFIVSITSLLPYNLYMNAHEYFYYKLRNLTEEENGTSFSSFLLDETDETVLQRMFEGYLTLFGGIACIFGAAANLYFTSRLSNVFRSTIGHLLILVSFVPTILLTYINTDSSQTEFFYATLALSSLASFGSMGLLGGGVIGLAATFPATNMNAVMLGQAASGILSSSLSIACQAFTSDMVTNGRIYFGIAIGWTIASQMVYIYLDRKSKCVVLPSRGDDRSLLLDTEEDDVELVTTRQTRPPNAYRKVVQQANWDLVSCMLTLMITLSAFPAVASLVKSSSQHIAWKNYFSAVCCYLTFNIGDACGRLLGNRLHLPKTWLLAICGCRIVFIPLIIICNVDPRYYTPTLLPYDGVFLLFVLLFAITHGYTITLAISGVARSVEPDLKEISGSIVNLSCVLSALMGSLVGVGLVAVL